MTKESENIKKRMVRLIGVAYLLLGFIVILQSFRGITGFVIVEEVPQTIGWLIGLAFIAVGIFVIASSKEAVIEVYDSKRGRTIDENYRIKNSGLSSRWDDLSLREFREAIDKIRKGKDGEELLKMAKEECVPGLEKIVENGGEKGKVAETFLSVLEPEHKREEREENYKLSKEEREEIKRAFRQFDGRLNTEQKEILRRYNLVYDNTGRGHSAKIFYNGTKYFVTLARTPSHAAGDYITRDLVSLIEERKREIAERAKKN